VTTTPTGHAYTSHPPPPIGSTSPPIPSEPSEPASAQSPLEAHLRDLLRTA
jgi:hypothetical protein